MTPSQSYQKFVRGYLNAHSWEDCKDGCPLELLDDLYGQEKEMAEAELIKRLPQHDQWSIAGLGHLRSQRALPMLRELLTQVTKSTIAYAALAIWKITHDATMCDVVVQASHRYETDDANSPDTYDMINIIHCLAQFPLGVARDRLQELAKSKNYLIAYNAEHAPEWYSPTS
jgi:hypothetical protein